MFQLNEQQVNIIHSRLQQEGIANYKLASDLLDHFCCFVEERMEEGTGFEQAYLEAMQAISPNGVKEIEFELFFIMNFNKQLSMKKAIFFTGFVAAFLLSTGTMFKVMQWYSANILLFIGFATLLLTALAGAVHMVAFLRNKSAYFWFRAATGVLAVVLISLGFMFRTFGFGGANVLYGLGTMIFNFVFLPVVFYRLYRLGLLRTRDTV